jgi:hypothetical protein
MQAVTVAALYVDPNGVYANLPDVEVWDEVRDARTYQGPWPVVAHPPCNRWGQLARVNHARYGTPLGEDGGCFRAALAAVRRFGGVLEHPAHTLAWPTYGLPHPRPGSWQQPFDDPGYVTEVSQVAYGHPARKRTWLYLVGEPVALDWREPPHTHVVGAGIHTGESTWAPRDENSMRTPPAFRDVLLAMARTASGSRAGRTTA